MDSIGLHDTSEQEILHHLYNKATGRPAGLIIGECDLFGEKEPWEIWDQEYSYDGQQEDLLVFTKSKKKAAGGSRLDRRIGTGTWISDDTGFFIYWKDESNRMTLTGMRQKFHYVGRSSSVEDGRWIMYEYSLDKSIPVHADCQNYVVCRIIKTDLTGRKKRPKLQNVKLSDNDVIGTLRESHELTDAESFTRELTRDQSETMQEPQIEMIYTRRFVDVWNVNGCELLKDR
ncbi:hypothetical protein I3760_07G099900 [Carya illinoinensis]|uniref:NAC domain-containing protein n=1 Tax=Carya illinoinensis TaxID=32201 RepID=A0A8T1Q0V9_CARIL|nr:NAC domain-containing protein 37-like [Carya illinoinensis]KAG2697301.1 hypothetical protein I3760_07G099900 [Carya illinoinensis]KAG6647774.1 hypothetical protein CIPAW_07G101400 [Carya illinoinensis]